jgi:hypothetical protein
MSVDSDTLTKARATLVNALMSVAPDLADVDIGTSAITVEELANRIAALQSGIEAIDRALTTADRYKTTYYGDT